MLKKILTDDLIKIKEYELEKYKFVNKNFPGAQVIYYKGEMRFASKLVNSKYTNFEFHTRYNTLHVMPYINITFTYQNKEEILKIHSIPRSTRLVYCPRHRSPNGKRIMKFSKFSFNMKRNNFKEDMLNECKIQIMKFIQSKTDFDMDIKHLDPRLKKILAFT